MRTPSSKVSYMNRWRSTPAGVISKKVNTRHNGLMARYVRQHLPEVCAQLREQAWIEITGKPAVSPGRPRARKETAQ